ncbi:MAG: hypothetical protein RL215_2066, partial [Planctomycetota bacterium]
MTQYPHNALTLALLVTTLLLAHPTSASAQSSRLELGRRLQRFEIAFEEAPSEQRAAALDPLKKAVNAFFSLRLAEAGKQLDDAWLAVRKPLTEPSTLEQAVRGLQLLPEPVCADTSHSGLKLKLTPFYDSPLQPPTDAKLVLKITDPAGNTLAETTLPLADVSAGTLWDHPQLPPGDHRLHASIEYQSDAFNFPPSTLSRIPNLDQRIQQLQSQATAKSSTTDAESSPDALRKDLIIATLKSTSAVADALRKNRLQETDYPVLERLTLCEQLAKSPAPPDTLLLQARKSDTWVSLARGNKSVPVRIRAPQQIAPNNQLLPVLFLFHGAGGSENMFFETYGAGRAIREATNRGWLVVAPGQGILGLALDVPDLLNALEPWFPIDRSKIMLLGHSMGAAQVIRQVQKYPKLPV